MKFRIQSAFVIIVAVSLSCCSMVRGQTFGPKYFETTKWASNNKDSLFFKSDTIKLVKIIGESRDMASYFREADFVTLEFNKQKNLRLFTTQIDNWTISIKKGTYRWDFDGKNQTLNLYFNSKLIASLIPLSQSNVEIKSSYIDKPAVKTVEIVFGRK